MSQTTEKRSRFARFGRWIAELILVFVGVYAAFRLSNYQQHQQDAQRRDQILGFIEQTLSEGIKSSKVNRAKEQEPEAAEFRRALDAGEMPPLRPFVFMSLCFHHGLQPKRPGHNAAIRRGTTARRADTQGAAQRRISYPMGTPTHDALSKIK